MEDSECLTYELCCQHATCRQAKFCRGKEMLLLALNITGLMCLSTSGNYTQVEILTGNS